MIRRGLNQQLQGLIQENILLSRSTIKQPNQSYNKSRHPKDESARRVAKATQPGVGSGQSNQNKQRHNSAMGRRGHSNRSDQQKHMLFTQVAAPSYEWKGQSNPKQSRFDSQLFIDNQRIFLQYENRSKQNVEFSQNHPNSNLRNYKRRMMYSPEPLGGQSNQMRQGQFLNPWKTDLNRLNSQRLQKEYTKSGYRQHENGYGPRRFKQGKGDYLHPEKKKRQYSQNKKNSFDKNLVNLVNKYKRSLSPY